MRIAIAIALLASLASAQCCLGAQNGESVSDNGRYRVRATSQTGTGPTSHGPYRFTFTFDEKNEAGAWIQRGAFERTWETDAHFSMTLRALSTGNGFLLSMSMDNTVQLIAHDGSVLHDLRAQRNGVEASLWPPGDRKAHVHASGNGASWECAIFEPFCEITSEHKWSQEDRAYTVPTSAPLFAETERARRFRLAMLTWSEKQGIAERPRAIDAIEQLRVGDAKAQEAATDELVGLGLSAVAPLDEAIARCRDTKDNAACDRIVAVRQRIASLARGLDAPWRNLELLKQLLAHPEGEVRTVAAGQLRRILPKGAEPTEVWLRQHSSELRWDSAHGAFLNKR
jgi:hypothetical protein